MGRGGGGGRLKGGGRRRSDVFISLVDRWPC